METQFNNFKGRLNIFQAKNERNRIISENSTKSSNDSENGVFNQKEELKWQYIAACLASIATFSAGNVVGWTAQISPALLDGALGFPITEDDLGWIASLALLGAAALSLITGNLSDAIGRRTLLLILAVPMILGWLLIYFASNVEMLYCGRLLTGMVTGANCALYAVYSNEIASDRIRGRLGSMNNLTLSMGVLFDTILGKFLGISAYNLTCACVPIVFILGFIWMPETPVFLVKKQKYELAQKALWFFKGKSFDTEVEIQRLKNTMSSKSLSLGRSWMNLFDSVVNTQAGRRGMIIMFGLMSFRVFVGIDAITAYSSHIFKSADMDFDPQLGTIVLIVIQVTTGFFQSTVIDKLGRRILLLSSAVVTLFCLTTVGVCLILKERHHIHDSNFIYTDYILLTALGLFYLGYTLGFGPIPFLMSAELFPVETKSTASAFGIFVTKIWAFGVSKTFIIIKNSGGQDVAFLSYACITVLGLVFIYFFVPETKGKSSQEIIIILSKK